MRCFCGRVRGKKKTSLGLKENLEGALAYALGFLTGILFFLLEKESKFVKFHAVQSTLTFLAIFVIDYAKKKTKTNRTTNMA